MGGRSGGPRLRLRKLRGLREDDVSPSPEGSFSSKRISGARNGSVVSLEVPAALLLHRRTRASPPVMELWQRQGFKSFGDWRRASEKARRAAKKAASGSSTASTASSTAVSTAGPVTPPRLAWQPLQVIHPPPAPSSQDAASGQGRAWSSSLSGKLDEHVQVTPSGRRAHTIKHTSPGGTLRCEEYVSPAGAPLLCPSEESNVLRLKLAAAMRTTNAARAAEQKLERQKELCPGQRGHPMMRYERHKRCEECITCLAPKRSRSEKGNRDPCMAVLTRMNYTESERAVVLDAKQRFEYSAPWRPEYDWKYTV